MAAFRRTSSASSSAIFAGTSARFSSRPALSIERAGREENLADVPAKMAELDAELVRLKAAIAEYLKATAA